MSDKILVRCNRCLWEIDNRPHWECDCHHVWDVFETKGICPLCKTQWYKIQCPGCAFPVSLQDWYKLPNGKYPENLKRGKALSGKPEFLHVFLEELGEEQSLYEQIRAKARWWIMSKKQYLFRQPEADLVWFDLCRSEPELIEVIDLGMHQIHAKKGFDINQPLTDLDVPGFNRLMDILQLNRVNRIAHIEFAKQGFIIDEFDIKGEADEMIKMFNKVMTVENSG